MSLLMKEMSCIARWGWLHRGVRTEQAESSRVEWRPTRSPQTTTPPKPQRNPRYLTLQAPVMANEETFAMNLLADKNRLTEQVKELKAGSAKHADELREATDARLAAVTLQMKAETKVAVLGEFCCCYF